PARSGRIEGQDRTGRNDRGVVPLPWRKGRWSARRSRRRGRWSVGGSAVVGPTTAAAQQAPATSPLNFGRTFPDLAHSEPSATRKRASAVQVVAIWSQLISK